jgi:hypothetical protein
MGNLKVSLKGFGRISDSSVFMYIYVFELWDPGCFYSDPREDIRTPLRIPVSLLPGPHSNAATDLAPSDSEYSEK